MPPAFVDLAESLAIGCPDRLHPSALLPTYIPALRSPTNVIPSQSPTIHYEYQRARQRIQRRAGRPIRPRRQSHPTKPNTTKARLPHRGGRHGGCVDAARVAELRVLRGDRAGIHLHAAEL